MTVDRPCVLHIKAIALCGHRFTVDSGQPVSEPTDTLAAYRHTATPATISAGLKSPSNGGGRMMSAPGCLTPVHRPVDIYLSLQSFVAPRGLLGLI